MRELTYTIYGAKKHNDRLTVMRFTGDLEAIRKAIEDSTDKDHWPKDDQQLSEGLFRLHMQDKVMLLMDRQVYTWPRADLEKSRAEAKGGKQ